MHTKLRLMLVSTLSLLPSSALSGQFLRPNLTIDGNTEILEKIRSVSTDGAGRIFVADEFSASVLVFDSVGTRVRTLGRRGSGPGEFQSLYGFLPYGDRFAALDGGAARIQFFDRELRPMNTVPWQPIQGHGATLRLLFASANELYAPLVQRRNGERHYMLAQVGDSALHPVFDNYEFSPGQWVRCTAGGQPWAFPIPFAEEQLKIAGPNRTQVVASSARNAVSILSRDGKLLRTITLPKRPAPVSETTWRRETADYIEFRSRYKGASCRPADMPRQRAWPYVSGLFFGTAGELFVESRTPAGSEWTVYSSSSRPVAEFSTPVRDPGVAPWFTDRLAYLVTRDESGVQSVNRYVWKRK